MAGDPKNPEVGELHVDASEMQPDIVDLQPSDMLGLRSEQEGNEDVVAEILANQAKWGVKAGVAQEEADDLQATHAKIGRLDVFIASTAKLLELLQETRALLADKRERIILSVAWSVDAKAKVKGNAALVARYEKTRSYRSAPGDKAARTRKKNAAEKAAKATPAGGTPTPATGNGG
ncbi:MAG: hypothetical protein QM820_59665 [Minicystis sp.]